MQGKAAVLRQTRKTRSLSGKRWQAHSCRCQRELQHITQRINGQVLVAGGINEATLASAELYNPATGTWSFTSSMNTPRYNDTTTSLPNGQVLVVGGVDNLGATLASAELYNPATGTWSLTSSMILARQLHTATLLKNAKVLIGEGVG